MNVYHKLLEIPESETPPDHYGLLGVPRFAEDAEQIHAALITRNSQLRAWDISKFYREANALLNEVVAVTPAADVGADAVDDASAALNPDGEPFAVFAEPDANESVPADGDPSGIRQVGNCGTEVPSEPPRESTIIENGETDAAGSETASTHTDGNRESIGS